MFTARRLIRKSRSFGSDETGALLVFALFLFVLMTMMGGFAVDLMRYERVRTALQNTLDRCTLNASALNQRLDPTGVVTDCVDKAGFSKQLSKVVVTEGINFRNVKTVGVADTNPIFMHMLGINDFDAHAAATAEQRITNIDLALVLDVSGSMSGTKIANLKTAASEFVTSILAGDIEKRISISIVPYNAQVNLGPVLRAKYNATSQHGVANVNCIEVPASTYGSAAMSRTLAMPMMAYADIANGTNQTNGTVSPTDSTYARPNFGSAFCQPSTVNVVRLPGNNAATLKSQINALQAGGNTSIMLGMKWGLTLIDPASRPMFAELAASNLIPAAFAARPFNYNDREAMKVIVLMTDGEHVSHNSITDPYKTGTAPIWQSSGDGNYSVFHPSYTGSANKYWVPHRSEWRAAPWNSGAGVQQQTWQQVWSKLRLSYVSWQFYARALGTSGGTRTTVYNNTMNTMQKTFESVANMNAQLQQSCALAKANNVVVFGIAFEAPTSGQAQISACASSAAHYFNAQGLQIQTAFRSIASNISQLKLTQ